MDPLFRLNSLETLAQIAERLHRNPTDYQEATSEDNSFDEETYMQQDPLDLVACEIKDEVNDDDDDENYHISDHSFGASVGLQDENRASLERICLQRGCGQSMEATTEHLRQAHSDVISWNCCGCEKDGFKSYSALYHHYRSYHQVGVYKCSFEGCDFRAEFRYLVINHNRVYTEIG